MINGVPKAVGCKLFKQGKPQCKDHEKGEIYKIKLSLLWSWKSSQIFTAKGDNDERYIHS